MKVFVVQDNFSSEYTRVFTTRDKAIEVMEQEDFVIQKFPTDVLFSKIGGEYYSGQYVEVE